MVKITSIIGVLMGGASATAIATSIQTRSSAAAALSSLGVPLPAGDVLVGNAGYTCSLLNRVFSKNETFTATSPYYDVLIDEARSQNCRLNASCVVTPDSAQEVSRLLQILGILETKFPIRSGGHNTNPGFSSIDHHGGLIVLGKLNIMSISADRGTVIIGPGNKWGAVYKYLQPYNVTVLGGREVDVSVGGGLSAFHNTHILAIDSVTRFQVVLPNGKIVDATETEHADLYKGLKGGLNNFGIVTEYDLTTGIDIYYELKTYTVSNTPAVLEAYAKYLLDADINSNVEIQINPTYTLVFYGHLGHVPTPAAFGPFSGIPVASTVYPATNGSLSELLLTIGSPGLTSDGVSYGGTFTFEVTGPKFLRNTFSAYLEAAASLPSGASQNGGNLLGLEATTQIRANIFVQFPETLSQSVVTGTEDSVLANLISSAQSQGLFLPYIFVNDGSPNQKPLQSFGEKNIKYIDIVAKKYDPKRIMQNLQNLAYFVSNEL
ncbi:FAD linked oxidase, N-terminal [Penicillium expansum]|uniref:FAD linked oxidase, N-terminal n=1 Tax=Penicillium expansum TaxID=27334 RepID=A0A0A2JAK9_PENEN|nr:FAD linked oxidase, N-terminal [Penicillium expansum]KGO52457.1 FAD linked oxidase, N-terminal [Penicillium expansum]KGO61552.1 FAD linked oxidase, N-terminal [Penicillium expansum]